MTRRLDYDQIAPNGIKALGGVYGYVTQSGLPAELIELVYLRVSQINNCAYCLDAHTRDLIKKGVKIEKLALVQAWAEAGDLFSERESAALAWAEGQRASFSVRRDPSTYSPAAFTERWNDVPRGTMGARCDGRRRDEQRPVHGFSGGHAWQGGSLLSRWSDSFCFHGLPQ